jgi:hypothetical protein
MVVDQPSVVRGERGDAPLDDAWVLAVSLGGGDLVVRGHFGEHETRWGVTVSEGQCPAVGVDDLRSGGELDLGGDAEPDPMAGA